MRIVPYLMAALSLGACSSLPHDGPSARAIKPEAAQKGAARYALVDLDSKVAQEVSAHPPTLLPGLDGASSQAPTNLIAPGDVVSVSVFEAGPAGIFARPSALASGSTPDSFPRLVVDTGGMLSIPFAGDISIAGRTPQGAAAAIRQALHGRAVDPQVTVTLIESRANSVSIVGEVRNAGHFLLAANNDRLMDVITSAGGPSRQPADIEVMLVRGDRTITVPFMVLMRHPADNIRLAPKDQVRLLYKPRKYTTFGALLRNAQISMEDDHVTLAAAISRNGGLDVTSANAEAVYVFRFERPEVAQTLGVNLAASPRGVPIIYKLNFRKPEGFFTASVFEIEPADMIYVPRSDLSELQGFFNVVNIVSQTAYNARVTTALQ